MVVMIVLPAIALIPIGCLIINEDKAMNVDPTPTGGSYPNSDADLKKDARIVFQLNADFIKQETRRSHSTLNATVILIIKMWT